MELVVIYYGGLFHGSGYSELTLEMDKHLVKKGSKQTIMIDFGSRTVIDGIPGRVWLLKYDYEYIGCIKTNNYNFIESIVLYKDAFVSNGGSYDNSVDKLCELYVGSHVSCFGNR